MNSTMHGGQDESGTDGDSPFFADTSIGTVPVDALPIEAKAQTTVRCRLCRATIVLTGQFRRTAVECPSCGLKFTFDPEEEPLPVQGLRLRYAEVLEAQRRGGQRYVRHAAHVERPATPTQRPQPRYFAWAVRLVLAMAAGAVLFGGLAQRLLHR